MQCPLKANDRTGEAYRRASEAIIAYAAGTMPAVDTTAFRQHLDGCAECKRTMDAQREVWSALDSWTSTDVPSHFDERLYAQIEAYEHQSWGTRVWRRFADNFSPDWLWKPVMPVAVACTALVVASLLPGPSPLHLATPRVEQASGTRVDVQQVERALDDLDMLTQFGLTSPQAGNKPARTL